MGGPSGRVTNVALLGGLVLAFATGVGTVATGSVRGAAIGVAHGLAGVLVVLLVPWKSRVVSRGIKRARASRWFSVALAGLAVAALVTGFGSGTGVLRSILGTESLWWHIAVALALVPLLLWHVYARGARPRRTDLTRRNLLRVGTLVGLGVAAYGAIATIVNLAGLPGAARRFTGSYEMGSFAPEKMPNTIWLDDSTPRADTGAWRLSLVDGAGAREISLAELSRFDTRVRVVLDCTSGWYAEQDWTGAPLSALVRDAPSARSVMVRSVTGYWVRFPIEDLDHLLLATRVADRPISPGHGFPVRLVAPGRRGFWWVKWVDRVELQQTPWWWQPPFPVT